jgi:hypothetical protein
MREHLDLVTDNRNRRRPTTRRWRLRVEPYGSRTAARRYAASPLTAWVFTFTETKPLRTQRITAGHGQHQWQSRKIKMEAKEHE